MLILVKIGLEERLLSETAWEDYLVNVRLQQPELLQQLVDYKTDVVEDDAHLQTLADHYTPQVDLYRRCWETITGEKVGEAGLFFTDRVCYKIQF